MSATTNNYRYLGAAAAGAAFGAVAYSIVNDGANAHEIDVNSVISTRTGGRPLRVMVSGAAGQICYSLLGRIANGDVFQKQPVILHLLDITPALGALGGVKMELEDGAYPLLKDVIITDDAEVGLKDVDVAIFVGGFPRRPGMLRKDLISKNCGIFAAQGKALEKVASKNVKILVVANPANTNCLILKKNAPCIPAENFTCLTRLDMNRAKFQIAKKANCDVDQVRNVAIFGNHSATQYPDAANATVTRSHVRMTAKDAVNDDQWLRTDFITTVQQRGKAIIDARKLSSAMSAANAICDHLRSWLVTGTAKGETVSMGVWSTGNPYGISDNLIFSFPTHIENGVVSIAKNYHLDMFAMEKVRTSEAELLEEARDAETALREQGHIK